MIGDWKVLLIVLKSASLIISSIPAYFLGRKFRRLIPEEKKFISLVCSVGILIIFFTTKENLFSSYTNSFLHAIIYGLVFGLASGLGNRDASL